MRFNFYKFLFYWILPCLGLSLSSGLEVSAQTVFWSDNFDAPSGGLNNNNAGAGWSGTTNTPGGGQNTSFLGFSNTWTIASGGACVSGSSLFITSFGGGNAYLSDVFTDKLNATPNISTVGVTAISLGFTWRCDGVPSQDYGMVGLSSDGGSTWNWLPTQYAGQESCTQATISIPAQYQGIPNFKVAFRFISNATSCSTCDPPFNIDNITLTGTTSASCTPPTVNAGIDVTICQGESVTLGGNPTATGGSESGAYVYTWTPSSGLSSTSVANPTATPSATTTYTVNVHRGTPACSSSASVTVLVNIPQVLSVTPSGNVVICQNGDVDLTAGNGFTNYQWSTSAGTQSITVDEPGSYSVTAEDINGCTSQSSFVNVSQDPIFTVSLNPSGTIDLCEGETVTLVAQAGLSNYVWSNSQTGSELLVNQAGGYSVSANNSNGCSGTSQAVFVNYSPAPDAAFTFVQTDSPIYTVEFTSNQQGNTYSWNFGGNNTSNEAEPSFTFASDGSYPVTLILGNACGNDTTTINVNVIKTGIQPLSSVSELQLLQSLNQPGNCILQGNNKEAKNLLMEVYSIEGKLLQSQSIYPQGKFTIEIDLSFFAKGMYVIRLSDESESMAWKWIK